MASEFKQKASTKTSTMRLSALVREINNSTPNATAADQQKRLPSLEDLRRDEYGMVCRRRSTA